MRRLILIDFDRTIFDTDSFAGEIAKVFSNRGGIDFFETYTHNSAGFYSFSKHLLKIPTKNKRKSVKRDIKKLNLRASDFLFRDVEGFLTELKANQRNIIMLITRGEHDYQNTKVYSALKDCRSLFHKIVCVEDASKAAIVKELVDEARPEETFYLDDEIQELINAAIISPSINTVLVDRSGRINVSALLSHWIVANLVEFGKILATRDRSG